MRLLWICFTLAHGFSCILMPSTPQEDLCKFICFFKKMLVINWHLSQTENHIIFCLLNTVDGYKYQTPNPRLLALSNGYEKIEGWSFSSSCSMATPKWWCRVVFFRISKRSLSCWKYWNYCCACVIVYVFLILFLIIFFLWLVKDFWFYSLFPLQYILWTWV